MTTILQETIARLNAAPTSGTVMPSDVPDEIDMTQKNITQYPVWRLELTGISIGDVNNDPVDLTTGNDQNVISFCGLVDAVGGVAHLNGSFYCPCVRKAINAAVKVTDKIKTVNRECFLLYKCPAYRILLDWNGIWVAFMTEDRHLVCGFHARLGNVTLDLEGATHDEMIPTQAELAQTIDSNLLHTLSPIGSQANCPWSANRLQTLHGFKYDTTRVDVLGNFIYTSMTDLPPHSVSPLAPASVLRCQLDHALYPVYQSPIYDVYLTSQGLFLLTHNCTIKIGDTIKFFGRISLIEASENAMDAVYGDLGIGIAPGYDSQGRAASRLVTSTSAGW